MKARVKATGEIVEIIKIENNLFIDNHCCQYELYEIEWEINNNDYWTRLEHQAAIAAMQGIWTNPYLAEIPNEKKVQYAYETSHALVEKYEKEERK